MTGVRWLLRPGMSPGESVAGYVYRLRSANGHAVDEPTTAFLTACYWDEDLSIDAVESLALRAGLPKGIAFEISRVALRRFIGSFFLRWDAAQPGSTGFRACAACLREDGIHRALWELPLIEACPVHSIAMRSKCAGCGRGLTWRSMGQDWHHGCGASILDADDVPPSAFAVPLARWISRAIDSPEIGAGSPHSLRGSNGRTIVGSYRLLAELRDLRILLRRLCDVRGHGRKLGVGAGGAGVAAEPWVNRMALGWPMSLHSYMERVTARLISFSSRDDHPTTRALVHLGQCAELRAVLDWVSSAARSSLGMRRVREEVVSLLQEHAAALDGNGWIVFHPRLSTSDRTRLRQLLDTWWRKLAEQSWSVEAMSSSSTLDLAYLDDEEEREQLAIQIMNLMIAVEETGKGDIRMAKVFGPLLMRQRRLGEGPGGSALPEIFAGLLGLSMGVLERMASRAARLLCEPMVQ